MISPQEVKAFFNQAYYTSQRMLTLIMKIQECRARAMQESSRWNDTSKGGRSNRSPQEVWIEKSEELQEKWRILAEELMDRDRIAHELIEMLTDQRQKALLEDRHIWRMSWRKMEAKNHYTERQMRNILNAAYRELAAMISDTEIEDKYFRQFPIKK